MARTKATADTTFEHAGELESAGVDTLLERLERVVSELEAGDLPLESALERFEEGVRLARRSGSMLDAAEKRVEVLLSERGDTEPLSGPALGKDGERP